MAENRFFVDSDKLSEEALARKHRIENDPSARTDHMAYMEGMERIDSDIMEKVLGEMKAYDYRRYTGADVRRALMHETCGIEDLKALLSPAAQPYLEEMAERAKTETGKHFGNTVYLFTPLYIANYCENYCVYCGFNCYNDITRRKLGMEEIEHEMKVIADSGMEEILLLTGESRSMSDVKYIGEACKLAAKYFRNVGLEIYPVNSDEYRYLHECGADYVTGISGCSRTVLKRRSGRFWAVCAAWRFPRCSGCRISGRMRSHPPCIYIIYSANTRMWSIPCPVRGCGRSSIMIRSIRRMCMRRSFARSCARTGSSCRMWALLFLPGSRSISATAL